MKQNLDFICNQHILSNFKKYTIESIIESAKFYLIQLCVFTFNFKNNFNHAPVDFDLELIDFDNKYDFTIDIFIPNMKKELTLRTSFNIDKYTFVEKYKLIESEEGGNIYISNGIINKLFFLDADQIKSKNTLFVLLTEDKQPLIQEKKAYLLLE